jgi:DNA repair ATPase RecN
MSDGDKHFLVTVVEEGSWLESRTTLKDAIEQLDWSDWVREAGADLDRLEERLKRLEIDMVAVKNTQGAHIKNCYHDLHDLEERLEVVEEWVRTFTDLTNSKLDWQQETNRTLYDLEERLRGLETKLEHVEAPHNAEPVYNTNQLRNTFASLYGGAKFQITHSELLNLLEEVKHV